MVKTKEKGKLRKFQLKKGCGVHFEPNPDYDPNEPESEDNFREFEVKPGEIVETYQPLDQKFVNKFRPLDSGDRSNFQSAGGDTHDSDEDPDNDRPVRDVEDALVHRAGRHLSNEELEGKPEHQKLNKGKKPASQVEDEEGDESDEEGPEDVTDEFEEAEGTNLKVLKHSDGKYRVHEGDDEDAMDGSKKGFTKKKNVQVFLKKHSDSE